MYDNVGCCVWAESVLQESDQNSRETKKANPHPSVRVFQEAGKSGAKASSDFATIGSWDWQVKERDLLRFIYSFSD